MKSMSNCIQSLAGKSATPLIPPRVFQAVIKIKIMHLNKPQLLKEQTQQYRIVFYTIFLTTHFRSYFSKSISIETYYIQAPYLANQGFSNKLVKVGRAHTSVLWLPGLTLIFQKSGSSFLFQMLLGCISGEGVQEEKERLILIHYFNYRSIIDKLSYHPLLIRCHLEVLPQAGFSFLLNPILLKNSTTGGLFCI